mmetsp:Transcript_996/g.1266  ORF Transcript_996/g.1266 Transcript_996/m.1266 type:complete len:95 (-) Transcript_996:1726-2010(-)
MRLCLASPSTARAGCISSAKVSQALFHLDLLARIPHMMYGALVKHYSQDLFGRDPSEVYFTSVMPCIRKRPESDEPVFEHDGVRDVNIVIILES